MNLICGLTQQAVECDCKNLVHGTQLNYNPAVAA